MFKNFSKLVIGLLMAMPFIAFAKGTAGSVHKMSASNVASTSGSEYFYQSGAGHQDVTPGLALNSTKRKYNNGTRDNLSSDVLSGEYEYGVMEGISVGGALAYTFSGKSETGTSGSGDVSGLNDLQGFVKGSMPAGPGDLKFGSLLGLSLSDSEIKTNRDVNTSTGRMSITPYVGYEYNMSPCVFGAKLATEMGLGDGSYKSGSVSGKYSGKENTILSFFYEHTFNDQLTGGAAFDWVTTSDTKSTASGVSTTTENVSPTQTLRAYATYKLAGGVLLPEFDYGFSTDDKVGTAKIDSYSLMNLKVGYRIEL